VNNLLGDQVLICYADHESAYSEMLSEMLIIPWLSPDPIAGCEGCACSVFLQC
jgi:hypothetical protein